jgi:hypothetical protein
MLSTLVKAIDIGGAVTGHFVADTYYINQGKAFGYIVINWYERCN